MQYGSRKARRHGRTPMAIKKRKSAPESGLRVDRQWFQNRLRDRGLSQRRLATLMNLNHAAISLFLDNKRGVSVVEAGELARLLGVSINELYKRLGVDVQVDGPDQVLVRHVVDGDGFLRAGRPKGPTVVPAPMKTSGASINAARYDTGQTPLSVLHNCTLFWEPSDRIHEEAVGSLCVVTLPNGDSMVRLLNRSAERGSFDLTGFGHDAYEAAVKVASASPVLWMKC